VNVDFFNNFQKPGKQSFRFFPAVKKSQYIAEERFFHFILPFFNIRVVRKPQFSEQLPLKKQFCRLKAEKLQDL
jgi:hypothetical protein